MKPAYKEARSHQLVSPPICSLDQGFRVYLLPPSYNHRAGLTKEKKLEPTNFRLLALLYSYKVLTFTITRDT